MKTVTIQSHLGAIMTVKVRRAERRTPQMQNIPPLLHHILVQTPKALLKQRKSFNRISVSALPAFNA